MRFRYAARAALALALTFLPALALAQSSAGGTGGGGGGSGGGTANAANTPNSSDGQATSSTNQQNVVYNYVYNGSTWDRVRGTSGAIFTLLQGAIPAGSNTIGSIGNTSFGISGTLPAFASTPTFNLGTLNGAALDTTLQGVANSNSAINTATGATTDTATASGANTTIIGALRAIRDKLLGTITTTVSSSALPSGGSTAANQTTEINAINAKQVSYSELANGALAASAASTQTTRTAAVNYTKFNATAGCDATGASLIVRGSNDSFATFVAFGNGSIPASSRNSGNAGTTISAPVNFAAYQAYIANGTTANTCTLVTSYTAN